MLEVRALVKYHQVGDGAPIRAVDGVSFSVNAGELVALYGPSGSGKTTLLLLIAALMHPDRGEVIIDGRNICKLSNSDQASYRLRDLGLINQDFDLQPGMTVLQNAALKRMMIEGVRASQERVRPMLTRLGLAERVSHRADQLSMGETQRVAIARALAMDPKLVLADEPTGNLDTRRGAEVLGLLRNICREAGTAVLLVTHDPQAAQFADRILVLRDGRVGGYEPELLSWEHGIGKVMR